MENEIKNRLSGTCETCRYVRPAATMVVPAGYTCARFPPNSQLVQAGGGRVGSATTWPVVQLNDGCGEHRAAIQQG
jgi:hypothetical protein